MSFSSDVKKRISCIENECEMCNRAQLSAMVRYMGRFREDGIILSTENETVIECLKNLIIKTTGIELSDDYKEKSRLFEMHISDSAMVDNLSDLLMLFEDEYNSFDCCHMSYVRGAFLGGGSITDPKKSYHLEFDSKHESEADRLCHILNKLGVD